MRTVIFSLALLACSISACAQSVNDNADVFTSEIGRKARLFCKYVIAVGTTPGKKGSVPDAEKNKIIFNRVPGLFWNYFEGPRYMLVTNGKNGNLVRKKRMHNYFLNLKAQSKTPFNEARVYELRYTGIKPSGKGDGKTFVLKRTLSDGSKLFASKAAFRQIYHTVKITPEGPEIHEEEDIKILEVFVLQKPSGNANVYLGDIVQAIRIK